MCQKGIVVLYILTVLLLLLLLLLLLAGLVGVYILCHLLPQVEPTGLRLDTLLSLYRHEDSEQHLQD